MNLPDYLGMGSWLTGFLQPLEQGVNEPLSHATELFLQLLAAAVALAGLAVAHVRYSGGTWRERKQSYPEAITDFLANGWYFDKLYRSLFVAPFERIAGFLRTGVEDGAVIPTADRLGGLAARGGELLGKWSCGRISPYLASFAAGAAILLGYMAWVVF